MLRAHNLIQYLSQQQTLSAVLARQLLCLQVQNGLRQWCRSGQIMKSVLDRGQLFALR